MKTKVESDEISVIHRFICRLGAIRRHSSEHFSQGQRRVLGSGMQLNRSQQRRSPRLLQVWLQVLILGRMLAAS